MIGKLFIDNPEKTTVGENDAIPATDVSAGRDVFYRLKTLRDWIGSQVADVGGGSSFSETPPGNPTEGQIWFDASNGNKIMRWNGTEWEDVQRVLELSDFGTGVKPVRIVNELPATGEQGDFVYLTSDNKLYRWDGNAFVTGVEAADVTGQMVADQIATGAITATKFAAGLTPVEIVDALPGTGNFVGRTAVLTGDGKLYRYDGTNWTAAVPAADVSGTITSTQIADEAVTRAKILAGAVDDTKLADDAVTTAKIAAAAITSTEIADDAVTTPKIVAGAVDAVKIAAGAVEADKIAANAVTAVKIAADAVTADKVSANAITTDKLAAGAITATKVSAGAIEADAIAAGAVTTNKIDANAITTGKIAAGAVTADQIAAGAVTATQLDADSVTAAKIAATAIQAYHLSAGSVEADKLAANAVTAGKIAAGAITADKVGTNQIIASAANIANAAITSAKIASLDAAKINAGNLAAVNIARSGGIYSPFYPSRIFSPVELATGTGTKTWNTGTNFGFSHTTGVRLWGPGQSGTPIFNPNKPSGYIAVLIFAGIIDYSGPLTVYYLKNGMGSYVTCAAVNSEDGTAARFSGRRQIGVLSETDYIDFYVAPCDGNGTISVGVTKQWELDITVLNW